MRHKMLSLTLAMWCGMTCHVSFAQQTDDPYARDEARVNNERYKQSRNNYLDTVRMVYNAVGCRVIASEGNALPYLSSLASVVSNEAYNAHILDLNVNGEARSVARQGLDSARFPGGCGYWQQHPEAMADIRRDVNAAAVAASPR